MERGSHCLKFCKTLKYSGQKQGMFCVYKVQVINQKGQILNLKQLEHPLLLLSLSSYSRKHLLLRCSRWGIIILWTRIQKGGSMIEFGFGSSNQKKKKKKASVSVCEKTMSVKEKGLSSSYCVWHKQIWWMTHSLFENTFLLWFFWSVKVQ